MSSLTKLATTSLVHVWPAVDLTSAGSHEMLQLDVRVSVQCYASINVKPEGGGDPGHMRHLTSIAFPTLTIRPRIWVPGWVWFFAEEWHHVTSSHVLVCFLLRKRSIHIDNQAFQNGRCHICLSLGLDKLDTGWLLR